MNADRQRPRSARTRGALLVVAALVLLSVLVLGVALLSSATSARYQRVLAGQIDRAYYLAESGASYAKAARRMNPWELPAGLFTLGNGDQFDIVTQSNANFLRVISTGIVNPGSRMELRRRVTFEILERISRDPLPIGFDYDNDGEFDAETWGTVGVEPKMSSTGPSGGQPALTLKGTEGEIYLKWQDNPEINLVSVWGVNGGLLCYDVQMKIKPFDTGSQAAYSKHYMLGISFRLHPDVQHCYGISYFRSLTGKEGANPPDWVEALPAEFQSIRGTNVYLVLWHRMGSQFTLLNSRQLTVSDGVVEMRDGNPELRDYSTLLLQLDERYDDSGGRENAIVAYIQGTDVYPLWTSPTNAVWQPDATVFPHAVTWDDGTVTNVDARLTTADFLVDQPAEIGVHVFYDQSGQEKKFFDDFAVRMEGYAASRLGVEIQY